MFNFSKYDMLTLLDEYVTYIMATCAVFTVTIFVAMVKHSLETAAIIAIMIFIIGPAAGFLGRTIYDFILERFGGNGKDLF